MLYSSLELTLEMETSKFTFATMSFQWFSNILNPHGELIEQGSGDCPKPSENLWVGFIQNTHPEHRFGGLLASCTWLLACYVYMCVVCVYRCIYINSHLPISSTELISA